MQGIYSNPVLTTIFIVALMEFFKFIFACMLDEARENKKLKKLDETLDKFHKMLKEATKHPEALQEIEVMKINKPLSQNTTKTAPKKTEVKKAVQKGK